VDVFERRIALSGWRVRVVKGAVSEQYKEPHPKIKAVKDSQTHYSKTLPPPVQQRRTRKSLLLSSKTLSTTVSLLGDGEFDALAFGEGDPRLGALSNHKDV
jgi:hypothetical protein